MIFNSPTHYGGRKMLKRIFMISGVVIACAMLWWLVSPLWRTMTLDEALPQPHAETIHDGLMTMDAETRERFMQETEVMRDKVMGGDELMPSAAPVILAQAPMIASAHDVDGAALLVETSGQKIVRFENLKTINGPDLRIYLSAGLNADDFVDLGPIRATHGNVNYPIPEGTDTTKYRHVLIWCRAFSVLFSYATL